MKKQLLLLLLPFILPLLCESQKLHFDSTFGINGIDSFNISRSGFSEASAISFDKNGNAIFAGSSDRIINVAAKSFYAYKINQSGVIDKTFGTNGRVDIKIDEKSGSFNRIKASLIDKRGNIYLAGYKDDNNFYRNACIAKLTPDGKVDTTFGDGKGKLIFDLSTYHDEVYNLAIDQDDRIYIAGNVTNSADKRWCSN